MGKSSLLDVSCTFYNPLDPRFPYIPKNDCTTLLCINPHKTLTKHEELHAQTNKNTTTLCIKYTNVKHATNYETTVRGFGLEIF